ncbi:MAG: hypothetical protein JOY93_07915 [Acidobacteriales bacterium]|nr:hypothetical protein [Terriglobales bacterium]
MRTFLAIGLGVMLSMILFVAEGFFVLNFTKGGGVTQDALFSKNATDSALAQKYSGDPFGLVRSTQRLQKFVFGPMIAVAVGVLVCFVDRMRPRIAAGLGLTPWILLDLFHLNWQQACTACLGRDVALDAVYLALGLIVAHYCTRFLRGRNRSASTSMADVTLAGSD